MEALRNSLPYFHPTISQKTNIQLALCKPFIDEMAYLAQPVIVRSPNVLVVEDAHTNLAENIVRSSHYIPDPSSATSTTADATSLHPSLKSLPYPLALPPVMSPTTSGNGADLASFEEDEDEDADTEDSRSLLSAVESFNDGASTSSVPVFGSFHDNNNGMGVGSLRGQSVLAANVRSPSRSPVAYQRIAIIPTGGAATAYPTIPTVPGAAVASNSSVLTHRDSSRVPGMRANSGVLGASNSTDAQNTPRAAVEE